MSQTPTHPLVTVTAMPALSQMLKTYEKFIFNPTFYKTMRGLEFFIQFGGVNIHFPHPTENWTPEFLLLPELNRPKQKRGMPHS